MLVDAAAHVQVIARATPSNFALEIARLGALPASSARESARFAYADRARRAELRPMLDALVDAVGHEGPLGALFAGRARELALDAAICDAAPGLELWARARERFAARDRFDALADDTVASWLAAPPPEAPDQPRTSDDARDPGSLVSRMREEIGRRRLPFRVSVNANLAALAATGDGVVQIVAGRKMSAADVERTVVHELEGHAAPRAAAIRSALALFTVGTAHGVDDQEGRAIAIEREKGLFDAFRARELALRHVAARAVEARADFVETWALLEGHGAARAAAVRIAARAHRGGGLAREIVYVPAMLRVEAARGADPSIDRVLGAGRVAVHAAAALAPWLGVS